MQDIVVTARIDAQAQRDLKMIAKREDRSISYLLRQALQQYVVRSKVRRHSARSE